MSSQTNGFWVEALHQAAVPGDDICAMIDKFVAIDRVQMPLGKRHAHRGRQPLPQRPGGGFHPRQFEILRMPGTRRSEEHTSELQSLMRISYAVFCLKKKTRKYTTIAHHTE